MAMPKGKIEANKSIIAMITGILVVPRLLSYIVAIYLIVIVLSDWLEQTDLTSGNDGIRRQEFTKLF